MNFFMVFNHNAKALPILQLSGIFLICLLLSKYIIPGFFPGSVLTWHAAAEITCLAISLVIFILIWFTYEKTSTDSHIIGFGFLAISVFQAMHILTFSTTNDYSLWFMLVARLLEIAIIFLIINLRITKIHITKKSGILTTMVFSLCTWLLVTNNRNNLPVLYNINSVLSLRWLLELFILSAIIICFFLVLKTNRKEVLPDYFIHRLLVLMTLTSVCFVLIGKDPSTYFNLLAHFLRVSIYILIFHAIFSRAVISPYERLEEILNHLPVAVVTYDKDYKFKFGNKKAGEITGLTLKELYDANDQDICNKIYLHCKCHYIRKLTGETKFLNNEVHTIKDARSEIKKIVVNAYRLKSGYQIIFDEAKKVQALENMMLQTQAILNSINSFIILLDTNQKLIMCNKTVAEGLGKHPQELVGMDILEFIRLTQLTDETAVLNILSSKTESEFPFEVTMTTEDGNKKVLLLQIAPIVNIEGEVIGSIGVGTDITDFYKEKEEQQQKEKLALLGQMAAGIVHEIRNPLTAIRGFTNLIEAKPESEKVKQYAAFIEEEVMGLNKIVSDYLTFAKPHPVMLKEVSVNNLIDSMKPILDSHTVSKGITLSYQIKENLPKINADERQIKQVILNIVHNAADVLIDIEKPEIRISTACDDLSNELYISIYNNGKILTEEEKKKIGTPFYSTKVKGTGLGLSICHQIMRDHNGKIMVKSEQGFGTVFELCFPAQAESSEKYRLLF